MAEEDENPKPEANAENEAPARRTGASRKLVGSIFGVVTLGSLTAFLALPSKGSATPRFKGPFHTSLSEEKLSANLKDNQGMRYIQMMVDCMYYAYDQTYLAARQKDPIYPAMFNRAWNRVSSDKSYEDVHHGANREAFIEELREAVDPILFPVHIGKTKLPFDVDAVSGLQPGLSAEKATFRGRFHEHVVKVDGPARTLQLDEGPAVAFLGHEEDVMLETADGKTLYVNVSGYAPDFRGEIHVGVHGRTRQLIESDFILQ